MDKRFRMSVSLLLLLVLLTSGVLTRFVHADETSAASDAGTNSLVQQGLTVAEIDRELARLQAEDSGLTAQIADNENKIAAQNELAAVKRRHAGSVLRAYYMGERGSIWMLLFSLHSFQDVLTTFEYLSMIVENDHRKLTEYAAAMNDLNKLHADLNASRTELQQAQAEYVAQRDRLVKLQNDLDRQLAMNAEAETIKRQIDSINAAWQERGIPLFRKYFGALADAMKSLPELATQTAPGGKPHLLLDGLNASFVLTDTELNDFLRAKNPLFNDLTFRFVQGGLVADGKSGDLSLALEGRYELNANDKTIDFHVTKLTFNGYELPDTTVRDLEKQVDLGFNPKAYVPILEPTGLSQENGKLTINLKFKL